jgi:hypothetical protein
MRLWPRRVRRRRRPPCSCGDPSGNRRTGSPDTTLARGGEARPAISKHEESQAEATSCDASCRCAAHRAGRRIALAIASVLIVLCDVFRFLPEDLQEKIYTVLVALLT